MILEALLNLVFGLLKIVFGWISLPAFPEGLTTSIDTFLNLIFDNITLLGFFIRPLTITIVVPILIILLNFEDIYKITMWILRKIPFLRFAIERRLLMLYADFNHCSLDNITYTVDMIRLRCDINYETFSKLESRLRTIYNDLIKNYYLSTGISDFKYNYNIEISEGKSFWFGWLHNSELINKSGSLSNDNTKFNFTIEFNPNKLEIRGILLYIIRMIRAHNCIIKSIDIAMDIPFNILDIGGFDKGRKKDFRMFSQGGENKTYYMGRTNNRVKIYNKKIESNLDKELTRIEITSKIDLDFRNYTMYNYNVELPRLYLNNYLLTFDDMEDKTLLAIVYAVQNGFPLNDLSRRYKDKVQNRLMEGGQKIPLSNNMCTQAIKQCITGIFYPETIKESL